MTAVAELRPDGGVSGVCTLDHTADIGIEAKGASLDECLARLGAGLFALMFVPPARAPGRTIEVDVSAEDPETLAVAWLEELLYLSEVEGLCFTHFTVEADEHSLRGHVVGVSVTGLEVTGPGVKAITRHGLDVRPTGGVWRARVLVDV